LEKCLDDQQKIVCHHGDLQMHMCTIQIPLLKPGQIDQNNAAELFKRATSEKKQQSSQ
jgi:hypothetical protein